MTENQNVPQEPEKHESGYSENIDPEPMDPVTELGDEEHHPERHESGYSEYGNVVDPTKNASE
ncbi:MAG: hypothetical protein Q4G46_01380 [Propionibacteriaceae bacterium]|nr:hypothetical protein [Propionibacteriaceae bacterium]